MLDSTFQIGFLTFSTYTAVIALAIFISTTFTLYRTPPKHRLHTLDVLLGGLIIGILLARIEHVLLNWNYFAYNTAEIIQLQEGGLDWHGGLIGAGLGMFTVSRWRKLDLAPIIDSLTIAIPLVSLAIWVGCWSISCRYGLEVVTLADYPAWMVWEGRDIFGIVAPRFHTQQMGAMASIILLSMTLVLFWQNWLIKRRFWLLLSIVACIMFFISFLQFDYSLYYRGLRITQYFDIIIAVSALYILLKYK